MSTLAAMDPVGFRPRWEIDKHVNISIIAAALLQLLAAVWFAASLSIRVANLETLVASVGPAQERITKLEVKIENVVDGITRIEGAITRLVIPPPAPVPAAVVTPPKRKR